MLNFLKEFTSLKAHIEVLSFSSYRLFVLFKQFWFFTISKNVLMMYEEYWLLLTSLDFVIVLYATIM